MSGAWDCVDNGDVYNEIDRSTTNHAVARKAEIAFIQIRQCRR